MATTYNLGIQGFKRLLEQNTNLTRAEKNKAVRVYKDRIRERLLEIKQGLDKERLDKDGE